jgi:hypothetical protein
MAESNDHGVNDLASGEKQSPVVELAAGVQKAVTGSNKNGRADEVKTGDDVEINGNA